MKKLLAMVLVLLSTLMLVSAQRVTRKESVITGYESIVDISAWNSINEVALCTTPDKSQGYIIATLGSDALANKALDKAKEMYNNLDASKLLSRHFACVRERLS